MLHRSPRAPARHSLARRGAAAFATSVLALSCSAPPGADEVDGVPNFGAPPPPAATGQAGASATPGVVPGVAGAPPTASAGEQNPATNAPFVPSTPPTNGNDSGANAGAGGASAAPIAGAAGSPTAAGGAASELPPGTPAPPAPPVDPDPLPPAEPDIACPADATFCSGFEGEVLPPDASFQSNPAVELQFDTTVRRSGNQSVLFPEGGTNFNIREIVVPIPGQSFWARLFIQTSTEFGDNDHDSLFVGSTARPDQDNNAEDGPEFSEQGNQVLLNANDQLFSANGPGFPSAEGPTLAAGVWHCVEAFFDGASGDVQIFSDGQPLLDAPGFSRVTYQTFRFGYLQFPGHTPRDVWYDDVVVAANRVGCN